VKLLIKMRHNGITA